jgi:hypothetical protein
MKITYFYRNPQVGFSIGKVFHTVTDEVKKSCEIKEVFMRSAYSMLQDVVRNSYYTYLHRNKHGINHITGHIHDVILGLIGCKVVLTIHDLVFLDHVKNPIKKFYKWLFWLYLPVKLADKVTCISEQTKINILRHIKTDKLVVIHNPLDPTFEYSPKDFNSIKPVILHIGTGWNKNLKRSIEALEGISCHLRIIGNINPEIRTLLEKCKLEYSNAFNLTDNEMKQEYINCDIVSFPSEYEGFGMPVIEGQKTGRVVLSSDIEPIIEVSGGAAHLVDPFKVESIREGYLKLIQVADYRNHLINDGLKNVERFDAKLIAGKYMELYKTIDKK